MNRKLIMYDFEVFRCLWLVVTIDYETKEKTVIINNPKQLKDYYELHKEDIWIGYNSRNYDQFILKGILLGKDPYEVSKQLIEQNKKGFQILRNANSLKLNNFDISNGFRSLKELEGFMGSMIKESSVPFDIQRELTNEEIDETIMYCTHDVEQTIEVFNRKKEEFTSQLGVIEAFNLDMTQFNKTKAQLSAHVLGTVKQESIDDEFKFIIPDTLRLNKYKYIYDWYMNPRNWTYERKLETTVAGVPHTFGYGGVHGAVSNYIGEGIILCCDVASLYPSLMINYGFMSRNVLNPDKYTEMRDTRLVLKKNKDKRQLPYKILLNATYGCLKDRNNPLYDPLMSNNVCLAGQLLLLDLIEKVEPYGELIQSNTDGIYMKVENNEMVEKIKDIAKEWEHRTRLDLEWDIAKRIVQKDVNNYILVHEDGTYKSKGAMVKELSEIDNDLPIVNKALIEYFMHDITPEETINNCNDLIQFQKIVKVSSKYKYALHGDIKIKEKVLRVFASKDENAQGVFKVKSLEKNPEKIANTPDRCFINNEDIVGVKVPNYLDKEYYVEIAKDRISKFIEADSENRIKPEQQIINILNKNYVDFYDILANIKENTNIGTSSLTKFIKIDVFKKYAKVNKILQYIEYFKLLYAKKNPKRPSLEKVIDSETIFEILKNNSEFDNGEKINKKTGKIESKVPTYNSLNFEKALKEMWDVIPDDDISTYEKIRQEFELYEEVTITDNNKDTTELFVLSVNETKNPSIIAYCINNGVTQFLKVNKDLFKILEIRVGDIIKANGYEKRNGFKVVGKDQNGINILSQDEFRYDWWITSYEILDRDYTKNDKLIIDNEELE